MYQLDELLNQSDLIIIENYFIWFNSFQYFKLNRLSLDVESLNNYSLMIIPILEIDLQIMVGLRKPLDVMLTNYYRLNTFRNWK